jgi:hypothetical protein
MIVQLLTLKEAPQDGTGHIQDAIAVIFVDALIL